MNRHRRQRPLPSFELLERRVVLSATIIEHPVAGATGQGEIVYAPGGDLWIASDTGIEDYNPTTQALQTITVAGGAFDLTVGPDGNIWYLYGQGLGVIDPTSDSIIDTIALGGEQVSLTSGPGQNVSFGRDIPTPEIGIVSTSTKAITYIPLTDQQAPGGQINGLNVGPDGNIWYTSGLSGITGREMTGYGGVGILNPTTQAVTTVAINGDPNQITVGPDGNMWLTVNYPYQIDSINTQTHALAAYALPDSAPIPPSVTLQGITTAADGNLWFTEPNANMIGVFDPITLNFQFLTPPTAGSYPTGITEGPAGNPWFTEGYASNLGEVSLSPAITITGEVFDDLNANGILDTTETNFETPIVGATVYLDLNNDGRDDPGDPSAVSNGYGIYSINAPSSGTYVVRLATYPGDVPTGPDSGGYSITVTTNRIPPAVNLGLINGSSILTLTPSPAPFGSANPNLATAEVNGLYETILGRAPDPTGKTAAIAYLNDGGTTTGLAATLMHSVEYETDVVASYYKNFLDRTGSSSEISSWVKLMQKGATEEYVASEFLSSAEYSDLYPAASAFVQSLYENVLGREGAASEVASWVTLLNSGTSRASVVAGIVDSTEANTRAVNGFYATFFARIPETLAVNNAVAQLQSGVLNLSGLAIELAGSAEFAARAAETVT